MVCYAVQNNQLKPGGGNPSASSYCVATLLGLFIEDIIMKQIPLTKGKVALVDDEDFEWLSRWKWQAQKNHYNGYTAVCSKVYGYGEGGAVFMHRMIMNTPKGLTVDHRNHNTLDNCKHNLRNCSNRENTHNRGPVSNSTSRYKGVRLRKRKKVRWTAQIYNIKSVHIGTFTNEIEAAKAYDKIAKELFGEYAYLNFPVEPRIL